MFARKYRLSEDERKALVNVRTRFFHALAARSSSPADFDAIIEQLKRLAPACHVFNEVMRPYLQKGMDVMASESFSCFSFLPSLSYPRWGGEVLTPASQFMQAAKDILYTKALIEFYQEEMAKEPRIVEVSYHYKFNDEKITTNGQVQYTHSEAITCTITFSDNAKLNFHSLDDKKILAEARQAFEAKMQALAPGRRLTCR